MASRAVDTLRIVPTPEVRFAWQGGTTGRALPLRPMARRRRMHRRWRAWAGWAVVGALVVGSQWVLGGRMVHAQEAEDTAEVVDAEDAPVEIGTALQVMQVRTTYFLERGVTYSGAYTRPGVAACSFDLALGTRLRFSDGREVVCLDRGRLGNGYPYSWVDVWAASPAEGRRLAATYGSVTVVEVIL